MKEEYVVIQHGASSGESTAVFFHSTYGDAKESARKWCKDSTRAIYKVYKLTAICRSKEIPVEWEE